MPRLRMESGMGGTITLAFHLLVDGSLVALVPEVGGLILVGVVVGGKIDAADESGHHREQNGEHQGYAETQGQQVLEELFADQGSTWCWNVCSDRGSRGERGREYGQSAEQCQPFDGYIERGVAGFPDLPIRESVPSATRACRLLAGPAQ